MCKQTQGACEGKPTAAVGLRIPSAGGTEREKGVPERTSTV